MLSLFPQIMFLSPLSPTLLRIVAGVVFLLVAWHHCTRRDELADERFLVIGSGVWIPLLASTIESIVGITLIVGIYTQAAAIVGALFALKHFAWRGRYPRFFTLSRTASALLFVMCVSIVITGAGLFAFDLPL